MMGAPSSEVVLIVAPFGRDAAVAAALLKLVQIDSRVCGSLEEACVQMSQGVGMFLLTIEALTPAGLTALVFKKRKKRDAYAAS